jgi:hypothetical protein
MAVVVACTVAKVEVAVSLALFCTFAANACQEHWAFSVVAGSEAFWIGIVDPAIVIVVAAVATCGDAIVALDEVALRDAAISVRDFNPPVWQDANAPFAGPRRRYGSVDKGDTAIFDPRIPVVVAARSSCKH